MSNKDDEESAADELLRGRGYIVRKRGHHIRTTILVDEAITKELRKLARDLNYDLQDAYTEAFKMWVKEKRSERSVE